MVKRLVERYQWRVFFESVVLGIVGLPRGGGSRSTLDMQAAPNESCFSPSQDRSGTCRLPSVMSSLSDVVEAGQQARGNGAIQHDWSDLRVVAMKSKMSHRKHEG